MSSYEENEELVVSGLERTHSASYVVHVDMQRCITLIGTIDIQPNPSTTPLLRLFLLRDATAV